MPEATLEMGKDLDSAEGAQMLLIYLAIVVVLVSFFVHRFMQSQSQADNEDAKVLADKEEKKENKDNKKGKKKRGGMGRRGGNDVQEGLTPTLLSSRSRLSICSLLILPMQRGRQRTKHSEKRMTKKAQY